MTMTPRISVFPEKTTSLWTIFQEIEAYHNELEYPNPMGNVFQQHREICQALGEEVSELLNSAPWKPWRPTNYKDPDHENMYEELADILFFMGSFMENWGLDPNKLEAMVHKKLAENYDRIRRGYNNTAVERQKDVEDGNR